MTNAHLANFAVQFGGQKFEYNPMSGIGGQLPDFGWDGYAPAVIESYDLSANEDTKSIIINAKIEGLDGRLDAKGAPVNGQVLRGWFEFDGTDRQGNSLFWKLGQLLVNAGVMTPEQISQNIEQGASMTAQQIGEALVGRRCIFKIQHTDRRGERVANLALSVSQEAYEQQLATPHPAGPQYNQAYYPETSFAASQKAKVRSAQKAAQAAPGFGTAAAPSGPIIQGAPPQPSVATSPGVVVPGPNNGAGQQPGHAAPAASGQPFPSFGGV